jgi:hypothetical protein
VIDGGNVLINSKDHPVGWAQLVYELEDAREHLANLLKEITTDPDYGEENFRVDLGHVLAHVHRAWNFRNSPDNVTTEDWEAGRSAPPDLEPLA